MKRKAITPKVRFEVFKRDKFKCQYCGRASPDVLLRVDHIEPVAKGGTNEITNLITSCHDCNSGKGATRLDENTMLDKMRVQIEALQERRDQLKLMMDWKRGLDRLNNDVLDEVVTFLEERIDPVTLSDEGRRGLGRLLKKYSVTTVLDGILMAVERWAIRDKEGNTTQESAQAVYSKIQGCCFLAECGPNEREARYVRAIIKNRFSDKLTNWTPAYTAEQMDVLLNRVMEAMRHEGGSFEELKKFAASCQSYNEFLTHLEGICDATTIS